MVFRAGLRCVLLGALVVSIHARLPAQEPLGPAAPVPGIEAVRWQLSLTPYVRLAGPREGGGRAELSGLSGRAAVGLSLSPGLSAYGGGMRVLPTGLELRAGVAGARYMVGSGRARLGGFAEAGYGEVRAFRPAERLEYRDETGYQRVLELPTYRSAILPGGGAGLEAECALGRQFLIRASVGYWRFEQDGFGIGHVFGGVGLSVVSRDEAWFWTKTEHEQRPPLLTVLSPRDDGTQAYEPGLEPLVVLASALSGIDAIEVDGRRAVFRNVPVDSVGLPVHGSPALAHVPLEIEPGGSERVRLMALDRMGNRAEIEIEVLGPALDREPPVVVLPANALVVRESPARVEGYILDHSPMRSVLVDGVRASWRPLDRKEVPHLEVDRGMRVVRFSAEVEVTTAEQPVRVLAIDSLGYESEAELTLVVPLTDEPHIAVFYPDSGAQVATESITVMGGVAHWAPLWYVMVGSEMVEVREVDVASAFPDLATPGMRAYLFEVSVPLTAGQNEIRIVVRDVDGAWHEMKLPVTRIMKPELEP